jgi:hypothetical protein
MGLRLSRTELDSARWHIKQKEHMLSFATLFSSLSKRTEGIFYGWWLVVVSGFIRLLALVPLFHAMGVWAVALEREFGWARTVGAGADLYPD